MGGELPELRGGVAEAVGLALPFGDGGEASAAEVFHVEVIVVDGHVGHVEREGERLARPAGERRVLVALLLEEFRVGLHFFQFAGEVGYAGCIDLRHGVVAAPDGGGHSFAGFVYILLNFKFSSFFFHLHEL